MEIESAFAAPPSLASLIAELLLSSKRVLILGHTNPDGDAIGSMLALGLALQRQGKTVTMALPDEPPGKLSFLPGIGAIVTRPGRLGTFDVIVALDCSDDRRFSVYVDKNPSLFARRPIINIDHHASNDMYGQYNWVDPTASATAEMVWLLLDRMGTPVDPDLATHLLTAIVSDTRCFSTPSTTSETLRIASELVGPSRYELAQIAFLLFANKEASTIALWARSLATLGSDQGIVWADLTHRMVEETSGNWDETDDLVGFLNNIKEARAVILFKENSDNRTRVSFRSRGEVDVAAVAAVFGGGGHRMAAGCTVDANLEETKTRVLAELLRKGPAQSTLRGQD